MLNMLIVAFSLSPPNLVGNSPDHTTFQIGYPNVGKWHLADIPACAGLCPLSGVKQTMWAPDSDVCF